MADVERLAALSMVTPLAKEVASQITLGAGNRDRLMALSSADELALAENWLNSKTGAF